MNPESASLPVVLLVEDDPVTAAFLRDAVTSYPADVDAAHTLMQARAMFDPTRHALLFVDANLPDGSGPELLDLRRAAEPLVQAVAHTADFDAESHARLRSAGFAEVVIKPLPVSAVHAMLKRHLPTTRVGEPRCGHWDDSSALAALGGELAHVDALRALFLAELPTQQRNINANVAAGDLAAARAELHRLAASCGFVGAHQLGETVRALQVAPDNAGLLVDLNACVDALLAA